MLRVLRALLMTVAFTGVCSHGVLASSGQGIDETKADSDVISAEATPETASFVRQMFQHPVIGAYWVDSCINSFGQVLCDKHSSNIAAQAYCGYVGYSRWANWSAQCESGNHSTMRHFSDQQGSRFVFCPGCTCHFTSIGCD